MTSQEKKQLEAKHALLKSQLKNDIFEDGPIVDEMLKIEIELGWITVNKEFQKGCDTCGS